MQGVGELGSIRQDVCMGLHEGVVVLACMAYTHTPHTCTLHSNTMNTHIHIPTHMVHIPTHMVHIHTHMVHIHTHMVHIHTHMVHIHTHITSHKHAKYLAFKNIKAG